VRLGDRVSGFVVSLGSHFLFLQQPSKFPVRSFFHKRGLGEIGPASIGAEPRSGLGNGALHLVSVYCSNYLASGDRGSVRIWGRSPGCI